MRTSRGLTVDHIWDLAVDMSTDDEYHSSLSEVWCGTAMELFRKLFGSNKPSVDKNYRGDYGNLFLPPSAEAGTILWSLNEEEQANFKGLLNCMQESYESAGQKGPISFHPEARASLLGRSSQ
jgi:hypothetical protein